MNSPCGGQVQGAKLAWHIHAVYQVLVSNSYLLDQRLEDNCRILPWGFLQGRLVVMKSRLWRAHHLDPERNLSKIGQHLGSYHQHGCQLAIKREGRHCHRLHETS